jgi:hypothetical protein
MSRLQGNLHNRPKGPNLGASTQLWQRRSHSKAAKERLLDRCQWEDGEATVSWKVVRSGFLIFVEGILSSSTKGTVDVIEQGAHRKCFEVHRQFGALVPCGAMADNTGLNLSLMSSNYLRIKKSLPSKDNGIDGSSVRFPFLLLFPGHLSPFIPQPKPLRFVTSTPPQYNGSGPRVSSFAINTKTWEHAFNTAYLSIGDAHRNCEWLYPERDWNLERPFRSTTARKIHSLR